VCTGFKLETCVCVLTVYLNVPIVCSSFLFSSKKNYLVIVHLNILVLWIMWSFGVCGILLQTQCIYNSNPISSLCAVLGSKDFKRISILHSSVHTRTYTDSRTGKTRLMKTKKGCLSAHNIYVYVWICVGTYTYPPRRVVPINRRPPRCIIPIL